MLLTCGKKKLNAGIRRWRDDSDHIGTYLRQTWGVLQLMTSQADGRAVTRAAIVEMDRNLAGVMSRAPDSILAIFPWPSIRQMPNNASSV